MGSQSILQAEMETRATPDQCCFSRGVGTCWGRNYLCQYKTIKNAQKFTKEGMLMIIKIYIKVSDQYKLEKTLMSKSSKMECKLSKATELSGGRYHSPI